MRGGGHLQYKKVRKEGGARVLALTSYLPPDWEIVKIAKVKNRRAIAPSSITLEIERVV